MKGEKQVSEKRKQHDAGHTIHDARPPKVTNRGQVYTFDKREMLKIG